MKFKLDENLPRAAVSLLRASGHDALSVHDQQLAGALDPQLADVCRAERRCLITVDRGFADLRRFPLVSGWSVVVLRSKGAGRGSVRALIEKLLRVIEVVSPEDSLWIVSETGIRVRKLGE